MKSTFPINKLLFAACVMLAACTPKPSDVVDVSEAAPIYPDFTDVTIPVNIAPLNFLMRNNAEAVTVEIKGANTDYTIHCSGEEVAFPLKKWHKMLSDSQNDSLQVTIISKVDGKWLRYNPFYWYVSADSIDAYLSYRLIEPGYEVWNHVYLCERNIESFDERTLLDNYDTDRSCLNCHIYGNQNSSTSRSMFHLRGPKGGTMLIDDGKIRKLTLKTDSMEAGAVYGEFHPTQNCAVFSSNIIIPALHSQGSQRLEVYDTTSDVFVADFDNNRLIFSPLTADKDVFETFPAFSADGKRVYFCTAPKVSLPDSIRSLKYSICRIDYDAANGRWGESVDTVWSANVNGGSACHPKVSPDGRYLMFTVADYGTFPIWHRETDLKLLDLVTGEIDDMEAVSSDKSETYHCFSSSGRWFVFASKRDDGQYGKPYFAYLSADGKAHKPFVLPQRHPARYDNGLHSYNIPNLSPTPAAFDEHSIQQAYFDMDAEKFK